LLQSWNRSHEDGNRIGTIRVRVRRTSTLHVATVITEDGLKRMPTNWKKKEEANWTTTNRPVCSMDQASVNHLSQSPTGQVELVHDAGGV
jgi:hypothetical protein